MGKAEPGTPKYVANQMKSRGLQKLRWYCQVCKKQCRDDNGYKCHLMAPSHLSKVQAAPKSQVYEYSKKFRQDFVYLLKTSHGEKRIGANKFYNEYIEDKDHIHMNATRWRTLSQFLSSLVKDGTIEIWEHPMDNQISWVPPKSSEPEAEPEKYNPETVLMRQLASQAEENNKPAEEPSPEMDTRPTISSDAKVSFSLKKTKTKAKPKNAGSDKVSLTE